ncbi:MAG: bifunctional heptose 7-phosphate kinase/heptose 1-phosphate adenyltransferase [Pirellulales bacterium]
MLSLSRLEHLLGKFPRLTIALAGDLFLDRYLDIDPDLHELSIETGLEAYQVTRVRNSPGALGTIINNLAALGVGRLLPATVIGDDGQAYDLLKELAKLPVDPRHILQDGTRQTPTYTKPMRRDAAGVWQELNRLDLRNRVRLDEATETKFIAAVEQAFKAADGMIVLDQVNEEGWGVITPRVRDELRRLVAAKPGKLMFIDSRAFIGQFNFGVLKPNKSELLAAVGGMAAGAEGDSLAALQGLCARTGRTVYCTQGERGMLVARPGQTPVEIFGYPAAGPVDTVGAGDSATAGIVAATLAGANELEAAAIGNLVASITVQQLGTTGTATPQQVAARWKEVQSTAHGREDDVPVAS